MRQPQSRPNLTLPLPRSTAQLLRGKTPNPDDNLGVWIDKFIRRDARSWELKKDLRHKVLQTLCGVRQAPIVEAVLERRLAGCTPVSDQTKDTQQTLIYRVIAQTHGRLLVDYGRAGAFEFSLSFHHVYGTPRISGSAIKGLVRHVIEQEHGERASLALGAAEDEPEGARRGVVSFTDALPQQGKYEIALDVLTPHFGEYYQGDKAPADWLSPTPFTFLTVVNTTLVFDLLADAEHAEALRRCGDALKEGLQELGIGAKRSAGYGYFKVGG